MGMPHFRFVYYPMKYPKKVRVLGYWVGGVQATLDVSPREQEYVSPHESRGYMAIQRSIPLKPFILGIRCVEMS